MFYGSGDAPGRPTSVKGRLGDLLSHSMRHFMYKFALSTMVATSLAAFSFSASAQDGARQERSSGSITNIDARQAWAARNLTPHRMELQILAGPTSTQALGLQEGVAVGGAGPFGAGGGDFGLGISTFAGGNGNSSTGVSMPLGFAFSPIDDLEVGIGLPIYFKPGDFGNMPLWATYKFMDGRVQLGGRFALFLPSGGTFGMQFGLPLIFRTGKIRLDSGAHIDLTFPHTAIFGLHVPLRVGWQINNNIYAGLQTGAKLTAGNGNAYFSMPLYGFVGYTLNGALGPIDLGFRFGFDRLINAGENVGNAVTARFFSFGLGANIGLQF